MSAPFFDKVDVFLPGHGQTLARAPAYRWRRSDRAVAHLYYSTTEPRSVLLHVAGLSRDEVRALAALPLQFDDSGSRHHDFDGFGLHLPGLLVTAGGTAIATCQKRHNSMADSGNQIDPMVSRSQDDGNNWEPQRVIFAEEGCSAILGPIFQNCASGTVSISFWKLPADVTDDLGYFAHHASGGGEFWLLQSDDEGHTWADPVRATAAPSATGWLGWPNNCGHGIQLSEGPHAGRLVIPAFLFKEGEPGQVPGVRGGLLYSDDGIGSFSTGAVLPEGSDEVCVGETAAGGLYVSYRRNRGRTGRRHFARSDDGGVTFAELGEHRDIPCRSLHAGLERYPHNEGAGPAHLFSNPPAGSPATNLTVRLSRNEGRTWPLSRVVDPNRCRYSDLAVSPDGTILCLYTNGETGDRDRISIARFNMEWLLETATAKHR